MGKADIEAKIEYQKIIGEVNPGGYQPIRFTRIKYKANDQTHIDIRKFQRGYDNDGAEAYYPTRFGFRFLEFEFNRVIKEYFLLPRTYIHPKIVKKSFKLLESGEFESAVLQAFKCIETSIRDKIGAPKEEIGIKLIRKAFNPETGDLTNYELPIPEREAFANYIAGAFGYYKNSCSHRNIKLDFISTFDRIAVTSDLLKIIENSNLRK
jgi:uncharacterized protein (TIGR02391 family)